jgi:hypothetical protein
VDAVGTAHHQGVLVLHRPLLQDGDKRGDIALQQFRSLFQEQAEGRVLDVVGSEAQMDESSFLAQAVGHGPQEAVMS